MSDFETPTSVRKTKEDEISLWEVMGVLVRRRGTVMVFTLSVSALAAVYAQARIAEVCDTPVITVLQSPFLPVLNDPRRRVLLILVGAITGGMIGIILAFLSESIRRTRTSDPARAEFEESWDAAVRGIPLLGSRGE